jgi:dGTP triphosphohydrolase
VTTVEHERAGDRTQDLRRADRGDPPEEITEFIAGMTDRFALAYAARLD